MKKFNKLHIAMFVVFLLISITLLSIVFINLKGTRTTTNYRRHLTESHKPAFEKNSVLFTPFLTDDDASGLNDELTAVLEDELAGIAPVYNSITLGGIPAIRITEPYLFNEEYLTLVEGRIPDPHRFTEDTIEILLASPVYSSTEQPLKIGSILKTNFHNTASNTIITINMEIVGKVNSDNQYPYPESRYGSVSLIVPDFGEQIGVELLSDRYEALYLTFNSQADIASIRQKLQAMGNVFALPQNAVIFQNDFELSKKVQTAETVSAIMVLLITSFIFTVFSFSILIKETKKGAFNDKNN